ncbi:hypothetical protein NJ7G_3953 [Natrinema sp. J7-2]|nr:hypothetical protein NJ7G_3953 [Natrinema sp. J7-2]
MRRIRPRPSEPVRIPVDVGVTAVARAVARFAAAANRATNLREG